jgi:hypothetical protein
MSGEHEVPAQESINVGKSFVLPVGLPLQVEIEGITIKMNSISIGLLADQYIIIKYPYVPNIGNLDHKLSKGSRISVRYLNGGNIFGFQSAVIGVSKEPFRLIFIEFPTMIIRHSLRKNRRVECSLPAELSGAALMDGGVIPDIIQNGIVSDISLSGCAFDMRILSADQRLPNIKMGEAVTLALQLPGIEKKLELSGEARRMQRDAQKLNIGILFYETDELTRGRIAEFILTIEKLTFKE